MPEVCLHNKPAFHLLHISDTVFTALRFGFATTSTQLVKQKNIVLTTGCRFLRATAQSKYYIQSKHARENAMVATAAAAAAAAAVSAVCAVSASSGL